MSACRSRSRKHPFVYAQSRRKGGCSGALAYHPHSQVLQTFLTMSDIDIWLNDARWRIPYALKTIERRLNLPSIWCCFRCRYRRSRLSQPLHVRYYKIICFYTDMVSKWMFQAILFPVVRDKREKWTFNAYYWQVNCVGTSPIRHLEQ